MNVLLARNASIRNEPGCFLGRPAGMGIEVAMPTVYIETYGCQMNVADTELMLGHLRANGYDRTSAPDTADVILLNTCAIREHAEARVFGRLAELARHKRRRPAVRLGVTGCMAQHLRASLTERAPFVDLLVGPDGYRRLPELLRSSAADPHVALRLDPDETYADLPVAREPGVRAWVTVMRGCDRFCTFCVVPYVRGRERSLPGPGILEEVRTGAGTSPSFCAAPPRCRASGGFASRRRIRPT
jgi:tRNA-2-methylthio-N6-dimethylallyladenosine synthase